MLMVSIGSAYRLEIAEMSRGGKFLIRRICSMDECTTELKALDRSM